MPEGDPVPTQPRTTEDDTPGVEKKTAKPADTVTLAVAHPYDEWNHGVDDVDPITAAGTDVPASKETDLRDAAKPAGVTLRKVR